MQKRIFAVALTLALCLGSTSAREYTLEDFNSAPKVDAIVDDWMKSIVPDEWLRLVVANDDCQLGIDFEDQISIASLIDTMVKATSGPKGAYILLGGRADYSESYLYKRMILRLQTEEWQDFWANSSSLERELECRRLRGLL